MWRIDKDAGRVALENCDIFFQKQTRGGWPVFFFFSISPSLFLRRRVCGLSKSAGRWCTHVAPSTSKVLNQMLRPEVLECFR
jgi:hypothetical protein